MSEDLSNIFKPKLCLHKFRIDRNLGSRIEILHDDGQEYVQQDANYAISRDPHVICTLCNENWVCINTKQYTDEFKSVPIQVGDALREGRDIEAIIIWMEFNFDKVQRIIEWMGFDLIERISNNERENHKRGICTAKLGTICECQTPVLANG